MAIYSRTVSCPVSTQMLLNGDFFSLPQGPRIVNLSREASNYFTASKSEKSLKHDTKVKGWHVS